MPPLKTSWLGPVPAWWGQPPGDTPVVAVQTFPLPVSAAGPRPPAWSPEPWLLQGSTSWYLLPSSDLQDERTTVLGKAAVSARLKRRQKQNSAHTK